MRVSTRSSVISGKDWTVRSFWGRKCGTVFNWSRGKSAITCSVFPWQKELDQHEKSVEMGTSSGLTGYVRGCSPVGIVPDRIWQEA